MGTAPPPDAPPPDEQNQASIEVSFEPSPSGNTLCGFGIPGFAFGVTLPGFGFTLVLPNLNLALALSCDLSDPIDAEFGFGGGRIGSKDVDSDDEFKQA